MKPSTIARLSQARLGTVVKAQLYESKRNKFHKSQDPPKESRPPTTPYLVHSTKET